MTSFSPLAGIQVLDLSANLPGPLLTRILANLGAEVIKVEPPAGEGLRHMPPQRDGVGLTFGGLNAGKDSIALNLKRSEGVELLLALAAKCDVVVEAFRPGKLAALGVGPEDLHGVNPRLVICSLSGYGQHGPLAQSAGHDINYLAHAGILGLFGPAGAPPTVPGVQVADVGGGSLSAAIGILGALMEREQTGEGRHLDISLTRGAVTFGAVGFSAAVSSEETRGAGLLTGGNPCYRCYETADGEFLALGALEPKFFTAFFELAGHPELAADGLSFGEAAHAPIAEMEALFRTRTASEWLELCEGHDVCLTRVRSPAEAIADPEFASSIRDVAGFSVVSPDVGAETAPPTRPPSALGADAPAVVERLGLDAAVVEAAITSGALSWPGEAP